MIENNKTGTIVFNSKYISLNYGRIVFTVTSLFHRICSKCAKKIVIDDSMFYDRLTNKFYHFDCFQDESIKNEVIKIKYILLLEK